MIYKNLKKAKIEEDGALQLLWPSILKFVGNVYSCAAVKRCFVPAEYVTSLSIKSKFTKLQLWELLRKHCNVSKLEFIGCQGIMFCNLLNDVIYWNHKIDTIVLHDCEHLSRFPFFDSPKSFFKFEGNTWTFGYQDIKIDLIIKGENCYLDRMREKSPIDVVAFFIFQRQFGKNSIQHLTLIAPYMNMDMEKMLTDYDFSFFYGEINVLGMKLKHDDNKAAVLVTKDETISMLVVLNRMNDIWKISSIEINFTGEWDSLIL